ncbi:MAG TPA: CBS domain-containing protein [Thermoleophilaceae bacterium]|nr:CBS domain-containing protein [Thermoleophilaceae bacterium]
MTSELLPHAPVGANETHRDPARHYADPLLDREVAEFMTPGCVVISQAASVADAARAMAAHRVHAILVVGARNGTPLGWITHRGLLAWVGRDRSLARASEAITEQVRAIPAHESMRTALYALSLSGTTRLLVRSRPNALPEGVLSDFDLAMAAGR